jgi:hypothetical protein
MVCRKLGLPAWLEVWEQFCNDRPHHLLPARRSRLSLCLIHASVNRLSGKYGQSFVEKLMNILDKADQNYDGRADNSDQEEDAQGVHQELDDCGSHHVIILYGLRLFLGEILRMVDSLAGCVDF